MKRASEIKEIKNERFEQERLTFMCMVAFYFGEINTEADSDSIKNLNVIRDFAMSYDFPVIENDGDYVIDTEIARDDASTFAKKHLKEIAIMNNISK